MNKLDFNRFLGNFKMDYEAYVQEIKIIDSLV